MKVSVLGVAKSLISKFIHDFLEIICLMLEVKSIQFQYLTYQQNVNIQFICWFVFQAPLVSLCIKYRMLLCPFLFCIAMFFYIVNI